MDSVKTENQSQNMILVILFYDLCNIVPIYATYFWCWCVMNFACSKFMKYESEKKAFVLEAKLWSVAIFLPNQDHTLKICSKSISISQRNTSLLSSTSLRAVSSCLSL